MLKRIYADNYRCLSNFTLNPQAMSLLLGDNGSGKTSVFEVLGGILDLLMWNHMAVEAFPNSTLTRWDTRDLQRFELDIEGNGGIYTYVLEIAHDRDKQLATIQTEELNFDGKPLYRYIKSTVQLFNDSHKNGATFAFDGRRSFLSLVESRRENTRLTWFKEFLSDIWLFKLTPSSMVAESKKEEEWLARDGSNFVSWYRRVAFEIPEPMRLLREDLGRLFDGFRDILLTGSTTKELFVECSANLGESQKPYRLSLGELSDGQRVLLVLYSVLHAYAGGARLLIFDEPDNFVALREIQPWLMKLSSAVEEKGCQAIVISHHPEVIDYLAADHAFKFARPTGDVVRVAPLSVDLSTGLKASELIARGWDDGET